MADITKRWSAPGKEATDMDMPPMENAASLASSGYRSRVGGPPGSNPAADPGAKGSGAGSFSFAVAGNQKRRQFVDSQHRKYQALGLRMVMPVLAQLERLQPFV